MVSRHSAFYSPLIAAIAGGYLEKYGLSGEYKVLAEGQRFSDLIRDGVVDIMQSAVSANWGLLESGESPLPVHFAQINRRDGFFLVARTPDPSFEWRKLDGRELLADHALQPLTMLKYAARHSGVAWERIRVIDAGPPAAMDRAFREHTADFVHLQAPAAHQLERDGVGRVVAAVGASMPAVAFSSLCCSHEFLSSSAASNFLRAFAEAREWVRSAAAPEIARVEAPYFPEFSVEALSSAIEAYQSLGCWEGGIGISRESYEQALNVFESEGRINSRHPYDAVCAATEY